MCRNYYCGMGSLWSTDSMPPLLLVPTQPPQASTSVDSPQQNGYQLSPQLHMLYCTSWCQLHLIIPNIPSIQIRVIDFSLWIAWSACLSLTQSDLFFCDTFCHVAVPWKLGHWPDPYPPLVLTSSDPGLFAYFQMLRWMVYFYLILVILWKRGYYSPLKSFYWSILFGCYGLPL